MKISKEAILNSAFALYLEHGYADMSISYLQEKLGIGRATMYYYFASKEELFKETIHRQIVDKMEIVYSKLNKKELTLTELIEGLVKLFRNIRTVISEVSPTSDMTNFKELMLNAYVKDKEVKQEVIFIKDSLKSLFRKAIKNGIKNGEIRKDIDIERTIAIFTSTQDSHENGLRIFRNAESEIREYRKTLLYIHDLIKERC